MANLDARLMIRITQEERAALDHLVSKVQAKSRSEVVRVLLRKAAGMLQPNKEVVTIWRKYHTDNLRIGNNLNQITRRINRGDLVLSEEIGTNFEDCKKHLKQVNENFLQTLRKLNREAPLLESLDTESEENAD